MRIKSLLMVNLAAAVALSQGLNAKPGKSDADGEYFQHIATFDVMAGNGSGVAEIVDVAEDGNLLAYTDAENGEIGFVDISDPANPVGTGTVAVGGEPTSLVIVGNYVLVGVNTSPDFVNPSGDLVVIDWTTQLIEETYPVYGQPDSLALSPDKMYAAIVIENERDEDLDDGLLPQYPTGGLLIVDLSDANPANWTITSADLSPVALAAPNGDDLEPEYVDINSLNEAVVTFQENNYLAVVDLESRETIAHFSAGSVELNNVDTEEEDLINLDSTIIKRAEPDAVAWINDHEFATANEGDYEDENGEQGGSRGFTIFNKSGDVVFESAESFEHLIVAAGQYNEGRSENKGCEPESVEVGVFGDRTLLFVGSERCNIVGVYDASKSNPKFLQLLPTGMGPEGLKAIPDENLFVVSTESEEAGAGIPTMINIYKLDQQPSKYPMIVSKDDKNGTPIPWVALSGLVGHPRNKNALYAVSDSFLASGFIYKIMVNQMPKGPARIVERIEVTGASESLDLEGIAIGPDGNFWVCSEGRLSDGTRPNLVLKVGPWGNVLSEINLPADLENGGRNNGFEGIAVTTSEEGDSLVYVAIQRAWPNAGDDDEVNTKIGRYNVSSGEWTFVHYPLEPEAGGDWIGLSDLTLMPDGSFAVIERDKGWGPSTGFNAELKSVYSIDLADAEFRPYGEDLVTIEKELLVDLLPVLEANSIWTAEKLEGFAIAADHQVYIVTDNDGVDDAPGETVFLNIGQWTDLTD